MELSLHFLTFIRFFFFLTIFDSIFTHSFSMQRRCHENESSALLQFKAGFLIKEFASGDPSAYPKVASWKKLEGRSSDCCSWDGVECDEDTAHVIGLDLSSSYLYGSIHSIDSLFRLVHLQNLNLADNHFNYSQIPSGVGNLTRLRHLNFSGSILSGQIPLEISKLNHLSSLDLSYNFDLSFGEKWWKLKQPNLLSLVQNMTRLEELHLNWVDISSPVPDILANSSALKSLHLVDCGLNGSFPAGIFQLKNLESLNIMDNLLLSGYLPEFHGSSPLKSLSLAFTNFVSEIPASIGNLNFLNVFDISNCHFSGSVPSSIGNLTQLISLDLSYNNLQGQIPFSFANLTQLSFVSLSSNNLTGTGSTLSAIGKLTKLTSLHLYTIKLNGEIPSFLANLHQLTHLSLSSTGLTGQIPSWFMNFTQLSYLWLESNQITGRIPFGLMNLTQLFVLDISDNKLEGPIPSQISQLQGLQILDLQSNNLSGRVDMDVFLELKYLNTLHLSRNNLTLLSKSSSNATQKFLVLGLGSCNLREFPNFLRNQDELQLLDLSNNGFSGQIPRWLWNISRESLLIMNISQNLLTGFEQQPVDFPWAALRTLDIRDNMLQGFLPIPPPSILFYLVSNNKLSGEVSPSICNSSLLYALDLSENNLSGMLPQCLGSFSESLSIMNLRSNNFHGTIPQSWTSICKLRMINLSQNQLRGKVPRSLANCTMLEFFDIGNNHVNDVFPSWLGALPELTVLILRSNEFHGMIGKPETAFEFPKLRIVDFSDNNFTGHLPSEYFEYWNAMKVVDADQLTYMQDRLLPPLSFFYVLYADYYYPLKIHTKGLEMVYTKISDILTAIDLSSNKFEGQIPDSIMKLQGLRFINISNNILTGHIPSSLVNLTVLESLDLSQNKLSGEIPHQLTQLTFLVFFNVSHNLLTGPIPQGNQFNTLGSNSFDGNPGLCGNSLLKKCENSISASPLPPSLSFEDEQDSGFPIEFDWKIALVGYGIGMIIGVVLGNILYMRIYNWLGKPFGRKQEKRRKVNNRSRGARN